jgi:hypothetical protein
MRSLRKATICLQLYAVFVLLKFADLATQRYLSDFSTKLGNDQSLSELLLRTVQSPMSVGFNIFHVRVPPDVISFQLCTPKVVGA